MESRKLAVQHIGTRTPFIKIIESITYISRHSPAIRDRRRKVPWLIFTPIAD